MQLPNLQFFKDLSGKNLNHLFLGVIALSVVLGLGSGLLLSQNNQSAGSSNSLLPQVAPKTAQQDTRTFRDFAEGMIQKRPEAKKGEYVEGTHMLIRDGAMPVALTSSVVDLSQYEGKKVRVFGETQKAIKEGWLMDVGKVEVKN